MDVLHQAILKTKSATIAFFSLLLLSFSSFLSLSFFLPFVSTIFELIGRKKPSF